MATKTGDAPNMSDTGWNSGRMESSAHAGQKIYMDFGMDRSSKAGSAEAERSTPMGGSISDLSHSLSGASAKQEANPGNKSKIKDGP